MSSPIHTIYLRNLNEKVSLYKLREAIVEKCAPFGSVVQVTAHKNLKMKGQAFITFSSHSVAERAIQGLHHTSCLGSKIEATFAKCDSDQYHIDVEKNQEPVVKRKNRKREREAARESSSKLAKPSPASGSVPTQTDTKPSSDPQSQNNTSHNAIHWKNMRPNNVLLLLNISVSIDQDSLQEKFETYEGFENLRFIKARNLAFITFDDSLNARLCLEASTPEKLTNDYGHDAILSYAKK